MMFASQRRCRERIRGMPMTRICALGLVIVALSAGSAAAATCDPAQYGARADGVTLDTVAIQKAIDVCAGQGGGTVTLTHGTYVSAPITLKSNITLDVAAGATLLGSPDHDDYPVTKVFREPGQQSLITAVNAHDIAITGGGTIDGNGKSWWKDASGKRPSGIMGGDLVFRPRLIVFDHSTHIRMSGVTVQNSPSWQIIPYYSDDVTISHIKVLAPADSPNTDAIDPFASSHVTIDHVTADVGDDNVAIKSGAINSPGPDDPSRDITITDCTFLHGHGLSVGSEIAGGAQNIRAERIHFDGTDNGIRVKANRDRGNDVGNLLFKDIEMKVVKNALVISEYYPKVLPPEGDGAQPVTRLTPHFHDITLENVTAVDSASAGAIVGLPEAPVLAVTLRNVKISAQHGMNVGFAEVTGTNFTVNAAENPAIIQAAGAKLKLR